MTALIVEKQYSASDISAEADVDAATVAAINTFTRSPVTAEQVYVATANLVNDQYDRSHERIPVEMLHRLAATIGGKSLLPGHARDVVPIGRWIDGVVKQDPAGANHVEARFYVPAGSDIATKLALGIAKDVSVRMATGPRICDVCGKSFDGPKDYVHEHKKGVAYDGKRCRVTYGGDPSQYESLEGSLVWLACQHGTQVTAAKAADAGDGPIRTPIEHEEEDMTKDEEITGLQTKTVDLETRLKEYEEREKAAALREARAKDGDAYHDWLRSEIARKMSLASGKEEDADTILKTLDGANLTTLKQWEKLADERLDAKFPPSAQSKQLGEGGVSAPGPGQREPQPFDPHASLKRAY
jgi:hypothetical protein